MNRLGGISQPSFDRHRPGADRRSLVQKLVIQERCRPEEERGGSVYVCVCILGALILSPQILHLETITVV